MIIRLTNSKSEIIFKPHPGPEVDLRVPSIEKAMTLLGYKPTVSLEAGVSQAIAWYRDNYDARDAVRTVQLIVTGASGFIGHNVLLRAPRDWEIVAVYHRTPGLEAFVDAQGLCQRAPRSLRSAERGRRDSRWRG